MQNDDIQVGTEADRAAREAAERASQKAEEAAQLMAERAARKMMKELKGADVEPKDLISEEDLSVLKI